MAETLLGAHRAALCPECKTMFPVDAGGMESCRILVCPGCGARISRKEAVVSPVLPGDRVILDRLTRGTPGSRRTMERWDLAVFRHPEKPAELVLKRIVGLPGEAIEIRDGDVYADGQIARKSLRQFLTTAVPVAIEDSRPNLGWTPVSNLGTWTIKDRRFFHPASAVESASENRDWIAFGMDTGDSPRIPDTLGYNQGIPRRNETVTEVPDFGVMCKIQKVSQLGVLHIRICSRNDVFELRLDLKDGIGRLSHCDREVFEGFAAKDYRLPLELLFAVFDHQVFVVLGGRTVVENRYSPRLEPELKPRFALGFGACLLGCELDEVRVFRDLYYAPPPFSRTARGFGKPILLAADTYYCLGDNIAVSEDSRTWRQGPEVHASLILGRPVVALSRGGPDGDRRFIPVPGMPSIRYIY